MDKKQLDLIKERFKDQSKKRGKVTGTSSRFDEIHYDAINLALLVSNVDKESADIAFNNAIVNFVTALEVYLKNAVIRYAGKWNEKRFGDLLKESITLGQAYELIHGDKISKEFLVTHYYSFQNFEKINLVFSALLDVPRFYTEIDNFRTNNIVDVTKNSPGDGAITFLKPGWEGKLRDVLNIRNRFIHDGVFAKMTYSKLEGYFNSISDFQTMVDVYLWEKFTSEKKKKGRLARLRM